MYFASLAWRFFVHDPMIRQLVAWTKCKWLVDWIRRTDVALGAHVVGPGRGQIGWIDDKPRFLDVWVGLMELNMLATWAVATLT